MELSAMLQKGNVDLTVFIMVLIGGLLLMLVINTLYEWLTRKPWQKNGTRIQAEENKTEAAESNPRLNEPADLTRLGCEGLYMLPGC